MREFRPAPAREQQGGPGLGVEGRHVIVGVGHPEPFAPSGREEGPNLGYKPRHKEAYFPVPPHDHFQDLRSEMVLNLERCGLTVEAHHHEVATGGQMEIDVRYNSLTRAARNHR